MSSNLPGVNLGKLTDLMANPDAPGVGKDPVRVITKETQTPNKQTSPTYQRRCNRQKERRCQDGSCVPRIELCPEEQLINQNTILIMIVVGIAVVIFVVILYCLQQRRRYRSSSHQDNEAVSGLDDGDNVSLYQPPPSYDEVISTNLYPPTPSMLRIRIDRSGTFPEEVPITPPPNYDTALYILSRSQELSPTKALSSRLVRRSISLSHVSQREESQSPPPATPHDNNDVFFNNNNCNNMLSPIPPPPSSPRRKKSSD